MNSYNLSESRPVQKRKRKRLANQLQSVNRISRGPIDRTIWQSRRKAFFQVKSLIAIVGILAIIIISG